MGIFRRRNPYQQNRMGLSRMSGMGRRRGFKGTILIALIMGAFHLIKYCSSSEYNPITETTQRIGLNKSEEIALGLKSAPYMMKQHGGMHPDSSAQKIVDAIGEKLINNRLVRDAGYKFEFHLLNDPKTVNAFALPGGQVFITAALYSRLENKDQLAGVIGHEIGHVLARHGAQRMAKQDLTQGLTMAAVLASGEQSTARMAQMIGNMVNMKYGRGQELESDDLGVRLMVEAGYDPRQMIGVMKILKAAAGGGSRQPEFFSTHPDPENRIERIQESIRKYSRY